MTCKYYYTFENITDRAKAIYLFISIIQFFYITILTELSLYNILVFFILTCVGFLIINRISKNLRRVVVCEFESTFFLALFFFSALITLFFSRLPYIMSVINIGLSETRSSEDIGSGGIYSIATVFFYPLSLVSIFYKSTSRYKFICTLTTILVSIIDIFFMGARNAPFFVIFFHLIFYKNKISLSLRSVILLLTILILIIYAFEYTTRVRSGYVGYPNEYWLWKSTESEVMSLSSVNFSLYVFFNEFFWYALPVFYLISYISHSIPELVFFLSGYDFEILPRFYIIYDYFLMATFQDRTEITKLIEVAKFHPGYYQTIYPSLLIDFGLILTPLILILIVFLKNKIVILVQLYFIPVMIFSGIENYLYTGLTPIRFIIFVFLGYFFLKIQSTKILHGNL